jgi:hypothetical protein
VHSRYAAMLFILLFLIILRPCKFCNDLNNDMYDHPTYFFYFAVR